MEDTDWLYFISEADTYNGPLSIGELFCEMFEVNDADVANADNDAVWQVIVYKYRNKG